MGYQLVSHLLPSVPVNHSPIAEPIVENSITQNAGNNMPTEGTGSGESTQKAENDTPTEEKEAAKDSAKKQKTEENASCTTTSKYLRGSTMLVANLMRILQTRQVKSLEQGGTTRECSSRSLPELLAYLVPAKSPLSSNTLFRSRVRRIALSTP